MRKKPKYKNPYKSENEMCDVFIEYAKANGWKIYPETSGWDILLVREIQIGVQAKLKDNVDVLAQACSWYHNYNDFNFTSPHPHLRAVLVPRASREFSKVAHALGIFIIIGTSLEYNFVTSQGSYIKKINTNLDNYNKKYLTTPKETCWVPEMEIVTPAGVKSPRVISEWKIKAIKLCLKLRKQGYITSRDFKDEKISITLWKNKWLLDSGEKLNKLTKYIVKPNAVLPDEKYPEITNAILLAFENTK